MARSIGSIVIDLLLAGTDKLRKQIIAQVPDAEIRASWAADLELFRAIRRKYLLGSS